MKIKKIELENFRGWRGKHTIEFSTDPKRPVTLILAENGTGKSNILEAIMWCLHGEMPVQAKRKNEKICGYALKKNPHARAVVRLTIEDDRSSERTGNSNPIYLITRELKKNDEKPEATVYELIKGTTKPKSYSKPRLLIEKLLPLRLVKFFLFSGEGIEDLFEDETEELLKQSIEHMQGLTFARGAVDDLSKYVSDLTLSIGKQTNANAKAKTASKKLEDLIKLNEKLNAKLNKLKDEKSKSDARIKDILDEISTSGEDKRKSLTKNLEEKEKNINSKTLHKQSKEKEQSRLLEHGLSVFIFDKKQELNDFISAKRKEDKMPPPGNKDVINNILDGDRICICGRKIEECSKEETFLLNLKETSGSTEITENAKLVTSLLDTVNSKNKRFREDYAECENEINNANNEIDNELDLRQKLEAQLRGLGNKDVTNLLDERDKLQNRLFDINTEEKEIEKELKENKTKETEYKKDIKKGSGVSNLETIKRDFLENCCSVLEQEINKVQLDGRDLLLDKLNNLAEKFDTKRQKFFYKNDSSYTPVMKSSGGLSLPENTGAEILKNIFYATSLIELCLERFNDDEVIIQPGTIAPMVCDAVFSDLSSANVSTASRLLTTIPEQCILMINAKSYNGECKDILDKEKKVGKTWFFQRHQDEEVPKEIAEVKIGTKKMKAFIKSNEVTNTAQEITL